MSSPSASSIASSSNGRLDPARVPPYTAIQPQMSDETLPPNRRRSLRSSSSRQNYATPSTSSPSTATDDPQVPPGLGSFSQSVTPRQDLQHGHGDMRPPSTTSWIETHSQPPRHWKARKLSAEASNQPSTIQPQWQRQEGDHPPAQPPPQSLDNAPPHISLTQPPSSHEQLDNSHRPGPAGSILPPLDTHNAGYTAFGFDTPTTASTTTRSPNISTTASSPSVSHQANHGRQKFGTGKQKSGKRRNNPHSQKRAARYKAGAVKKSYHKLQLQASGSGSGSGSGPMIIGGPSASGKLMWDRDGSVRPVWDDYTNLSLPDLDHAKNLVLDLLGWGVETEYLLRSGVSSQLIHRVFTDLRLRLPPGFVAPSEPVARNRVVATTASASVAVPAS